MLSSWQRSESQTRSGVLPATEFVSYGGWLPILLLFLLVTDFVGAGDRRWEFRRVQMGTEFHLIFFSSEEAVARRASEAAFERIAELEGILSDYRMDSELLRASRKAGQEPVVVSRDLFRVIRASLDYARISGGAFDPTVRPFVELWRLAGRSGRMPDSGSLREASERVGYQLVLLNERTGSLRFKKSGVKLDFGGIGKGYAADEALQVLREQGIESALVDAGGDLRMGKAPPGAKGWRVQVRKTAYTEELPSMWLSESAVATSGDGYQSFEIAGEHYSHIVDPRSGKGIQHLGMVTVIAPSAMAADSLATACSVLEIEEAMRLISSLDEIEASIWRESGGVRRWRLSDGFPALTDRNK